MRRENTNKEDRCGWSVPCNNELRSRLNESKRKYVIGRSNAHDWTRTCFIECRSNEHISDASTYRRWKRYRVSNLVNLYSRCIKLTLMWTMA